MKKKYIACALLVKNRKILLQNRKGISKYGEEWSFFGGKIEKCEKPEQGLLREIKEELNFDISNWDIKYLGEIVHYMYKFDIEYHRFLYLIRIPNNIKNFNDQEGSGACFFDIDYISNLNFNTPIDSELFQLKNNI